MLSTGCVDRSDCADSASLPWRAALPPPMRCQNETACVGSKHALAMISRPMWSASLSIVREFGSDMSRLSAMRLSPMSKPSMSMNSPSTYTTVSPDIFSAGCRARTCAISCESTVASPSSFWHTGRMPVNTKMEPPGSANAFFSGLAMTCTFHCVGGAPGARSRSRSPHTSMMRCATLRTRTASGDHDDRTRSPYVCMVCSYDWRPSWSSSVTLTSRKRQRPVSGTCCRWQT